MINPKNKRVMITLTEESTQLLNSLSTRYNKSKSEIIKWALNVLAAKKNHNLVIKLREQEILEPVQPLTGVVLNGETYEYQETKEPESPYDPDLPFAKYK